ncbi:MAG: tRNA 2-thiouridine(34) synthase MnmA, partial [Clostridia bacterium]|nr:tRNA 2-thiouridine(34) synthase MnmA [Clostridia bacterium]
RPDEPLKVQAKIRYNQKAQPAVLYPLSDDTFKLVFDSPQRAITPGQAAVCYCGDLLICGGTISIHNS